MLPGPWCFAPHPEVLKSCADEHRPSENILTTTHPCFTFYVTALAYQKGVLWTCATVITDRNL